MLASFRPLSNKLVSSSTKSLFSRALATGSVKWFNNTKGFGFITQDDPGAPDVFVHQSSIKSNAFRYLEPGERVKFDIVKEEKGVKADNVTNEDGTPFNRPERSQQRQ